jgi:hypothetical protein
VNLNNLRFFYIPMTGYIKTLVLILTITAALSLLTYLLLSDMPNWRRQRRKLRPEVLEPAWVSSDAEADLITEIEQVLREEARGK